MRRSLRALPVMAALLLAGCSDNTSKPPDARVDKKVVRDQPQPDVPDAAWDVAEATAGDARREGLKDVRPPDAVKDQGPTDIGYAVVYGTITRTAVPIGDAK